jgi:hypothetical protein
VLGLRSRPVRSRRLISRVAAILPVVDMLVAILTVQIPNVFFTHEFPLVLLAAGVARAIAGPGEVALDRVLAARTRNPTLARLTRGWEARFPRITLIGNRSGQLRVSTGSAVFAAGANVGTRKGLATEAGSSAWARAAPITISIV